MKNTFDTAWAAIIDWNDQWLLRGSVKYYRSDQGRDRDVNFQMAENLAPVGSRYQMNKRIAF